MRTNSHISELVHFLIFLCSENSGQRDAKGIVYNPASIYYSHLTMETPDYV